MAKDSLSDQPAMKLGAKTHWGTAEDTIWLPISVIFTHWRDNNEGQKTSTKEAATKCYSFSNCVDRSYEEKKNFLGLFFF